MYNVKSFCTHLSSLVGVATAYKDDVCDPNVDRKVSGVASKDWHTRLTVKEVARLFNTGINTAKAMLKAMT